MRFRVPEKMDELLHIGFVNDGREIPEAITEDASPDLTNEEDDERTRRMGFLMFWTLNMSSFRLLKNSLLI